jgi:hypothetical protein
MSNSYRFRAGYRSPKGINPDDVVGVFQRLQVDGALTPSRVLESAQPDDAPLHNAFEWDDTTAGNEYRLIQARQLIRAVVVVVESDEGVKSEPQSMFVHVPDSAAAEGRYVDLTEVANDEADFERALVEAQRYLASAERAVNDLRRQAEKRGGPVEALAIALGGLDTVRQALEILRTQPQAA